MATKILDWDADSLGSTGSAVSSWTDSVGSRALSQSDANLQPSVVAGPNGHKAVKFAGDFLLGTAGSTAAQGSMTIALVMRQDAQGSVLRAGVLGGYATGAANDYSGSGWNLTHTLATTDTEFKAMTAGGAVGAGTDTRVKNSGHPLNSWVIVTGTVGGDNAQGTFYFNGTADGTVPASTQQNASLTNIFMGGRFFGATGGNDFGTFSVAEVRVYSGRMTTSERASLHTELQDKYNIAVSDYVSTRGVVNNGLVGRFKASSISGVANGGAVNSWSDIAGTRTLTTRNASPTLVTGAANGKSAVRFNGSTQDLKMDNPPSITQPYTIIAVARNGSATFSDRQLLFQGSGGEILITGDGYWLTYAGAGRTSTAKVTTSPTVLTSVFNSDAATSQVFINGALDSTANVGTGAMDQGVLIVGNHVNITRYWNGDVFELLFYNRVLTSAERAQIHSYVQDEYGITVSDYVAGGTTADTTAPTIPSNVSATASSSTSVSISWSASTDATGVASYRIRRGGSDLSGATALTSTNYVDNTVSASTAYSYTVSAVDAAGNRSAESSNASVTTPATATATSGRLISRWNGSALVNQAVSRWDGSALTTRIIDAILPATGTGTGGSTVPTGSSVAARWWIVSGGTPTNRVTWETGVNASGKAQVVWVGSFPDVRARSTPRETGVAAMTQDAFQAYIVDTTSNSTVADSGVTISTDERWVASSFTPVAGRVYIGYARVRTNGSSWSSYASSRFVAPSGRTLYLEDYGAVGDGSSQDGTDYRNSIYTGPVRNALKAAQPGDVVKSKNPGTVLLGLTALSTTLSSSSAVFTSSMAGKKVLVYGAGTSDTSSNSYAHRTTIASVAADLKSVTLNNAVLTSGTNLTAVVDYREYRVGHMDIDNGLGTPGNGGGWTLDGTGCVFTSTDVDYSGFRTTVPNVTYRNVHYWQKTQTTRGDGKNNNTGPFFVEGTAAVGLRFIGCYAERARDAGFLVYGGPSDIHFVDCVADHTNADGFHVTGSAHDVQFIRPLNVWIGDDAVANIGYRSDGDGARPYNITWESPRVLGQDWGRGVSFGGCYNALVTDLYMERGAGASFILGSDGDMANTANVQMRRGRIVSPNLRRGSKPTYSQGSGTGSTIPDEPWLKILNSSSSTRQRDILLEDFTVSDGRYVQIISYGGGEFQDATIIVRGVTMTGSVNSGTGWLDQSTYSGHIDMRGVTVPSGSTTASAPTNSNSAPAATALAVTGTLDGTMTLTGSGVADNGNGTYTVADPSVVDNGNGTFTITY